MNLPCSLMMNKFTHRSDQKELLDELNIPKQLLHQNLRELDILNRTTGGHSISLRGIKQLITDPKKWYHIVDLGCGSGDSLKAIAHWARKHKFNVKLTGVDMNAHAIDYLKIHCATFPEISGFFGDYQDYMENNKTVDIVLCSLFCHHLSDNELLSLFSWFKVEAGVGFVINDLKRNWLAYYSAWIFTRLFNGTKLARNDGPISVLRGFKFNELDNLLIKSSITNYSIKEQWIFRFLIVGKTQNHESKQK